MWLLVTMVDRAGCTTVSSSQRDLLAASEGNLSMNGSQVKKDGEAEGMTKTSHSI